MIFDRILSPEESGQVLAQLQALQTFESFHARALVQDRDRVEQWHIEVDRAGEAWFATAEHGHVEEFRGGVRFDRGEVFQLPAKLADFLPPAIKPAFPETLGWWGEHDHGYRPVLVERVGRKSMLLTFEHGSDPAMRSTMVFDTELGIVTRTIGFDSATLLVDIEPGKPIERHVPASFPELEVIYPDY
ncbi:hypothetical protein ACFSWE_15010 [Leucobacter albus]|uniref:Outer membrane lipoprotein carrier protein LolA n=1 Tax=Leucobacter albus TaxID=272210 RepID=A0ABW3TLM6_9MICO